MPKPVPFPAGRIVITAGAVVELAGYDPKLGADQAAAKLLGRHMMNDWGDLDAHDRKVNANAVRHGNRILSNYKLPNGESVPVSSGRRGF